MDGEQARRDVTLEDLLAAGKEALASGDRAAAHELLRAAAVANPYDERVWVALLDVLTSDDDREVCLENIIAINPLNPDARRHLRGLKRNRRLKEETLSVPITPLPQQEQARASGGRALLRAIAMGIGIGLLAVVLGVVTSVVVYGGILARLKP